MVPTDCGRQKDTRVAISLNQPPTAVAGLPENLSYNWGRNANSAVS
jgi:hypothetical protein